MRIVFMGSADFAVPTLEALIDSKHEVLAVVTQPDRPRGRGQKLAVTPVKERALAAGLPIFQPQSAKTAEFVEWLRQLAPTVAVVVAYGQILPPAVLAVPTQGCINVHASLLPRYRGAAPIHWAVMQGETVTGVSTMFMDVGLDSGDIILQQPIPLPAEATSGDLYPVLAAEGARLLRETLEMLEKGTVPRVPQNSAEATFAPSLTRKDEVIDWSKPAEALCNQIRGLNPWPGAYTEWNGKVLKVWRALSAAALGNNNLYSLEAGSGGRLPGQVVGVDKTGLLVQTGKGLLLLTEVQPTGKQRMPAADFSRGYRVEPGAMLG